jgi:hypothetical protein
MSIKTNNNSLMNDSDHFTTTDSVFSEFQVDLKNVYNFKN